jgi:hypothetical protein
VIRQATHATVVLRNGAPAALLVSGRSCAEHKRTMDAFGTIMGLTVADGHATYRQARRIRPNAWFKRRASLVRPVTGNEVLCLGLLPQSRQAAQIAAIHTPAAYEIAIGSIGGPWSRVSPPGFEEAYLDILAHSEDNLAIAYDDRSVVIGGWTDTSIGVVRWLADLFAKREVRFLSGERFLAFCDGPAARDLLQDGTISLSRLPDSYMRRDFVIATRAAQAAA